MTLDSVQSIQEGDSLAVAARDKDRVLFLKDATKFKTDGAYLHGKWIIETLRRYEDDPRRNVLAPIERAVARYAASPQGRKRMDGRYYMAYLAFVFSRHADVRPFWQSAGHSIWTSAGFKERPSYQTLHLRFTELEHPQIIAAFELAAARLIYLAHIGSHGVVGRFLHVDSTEAETHARLEHVCPSWSACWRKAAAKNGRSSAQRAADQEDPSEPSENGEGGARPDGKARAGTRLTAGESVNVIREERHDHAVEPEPEDLTAEDTELGSAELLVRSREKLRVKVGGCIYDVLDPTAGIRAYTGPNGKLRKFWVGFYNAKAIDHFTGAPVAVRITSASTQEFVTYPDLLQAAIANTGVLPRAVVGDRGYSVSSVFEHNTRRGIASVFPWRASGSRLQREQEDCDTHDRHGVVRCKHCGAPTRFASFAKTAGVSGTSKNGETSYRGPRLYVLCQQPVTEACEKRQSIACETSWRMLLPLWRTDPTYLALRHSHDRYERVHHHWRVRWRSGADDHSLRPKRRGRDCQQLRANAALLIEWLFICHRERWLPDHRPRGVPDPERVIEDDGSIHATKLADYRHDLGLDYPYGSKAVALKIAQHRPTPGSRQAPEEDPVEPDDQLLLHPALEVDPDPPSAGHAPQNAAEVDLDDLPF